MSLLRLMLVSLLNDTPPQLLYVCATRSCLYFYYSSDVPIIKSICTVYTAQVINP